MKVHLKRATQGVFLACVLTSPISFALEVGDAIDTKTAAALNLPTDKVAVVDFFAEWCESCRKELPLISKLNTRLGGDEVEFIGVDTDDSEAVAIAFQQELTSQGNLNFNVINDTDQSIVSTFQPLGFPALYIIKNNKIVGAHIGAVDGIDLAIENDLKRLMETQP